MASRKKTIKEEDIKEWIERGVRSLEEKDWSYKKKKSKIRYAGNGGWFWCLGFFGAVVYFWQYVNSFGTGVVAIIKAFVWPAFLVLNLFKFLRI